MEKVLVASLTILLGLVFHLSHVANAETTPSSQAALAQHKQPAVPLITVNSPKSDLPISGTFYIRGTASTQDSVKKITITLTSLYDRRQEPLKTYNAKYDNASQTWSAKIADGELEEGMYIVQVALENTAGETTYTFSSFIVSPNDKAMNTI